MPARTPEIRYRRHVIKAMKCEAGWQARALRGRIAVGAPLIAADRESAILAVKQSLDEVAALYRSLRGADDYPCAQEVRAAWPHVKRSKAQNAMLAAHLDASGHVLTATQLAQAAGYSDYVVANAQYGQLGRALAEELDWTPQERKDGSPIWTTALATGAQDTPGDQSQEPASHWRWKLRPEIVAAMGD